jgi:dTDP-4-dehydrorhamnose reductase
MRILVTGGDGLLARAIQDAAPAGAEVLLLSHGEFDLTQVELMDRRLASFRPQIVINTAAYNGVDRCEVERELSWAVNATGPLRLAERCAKHRCRLIHYSTDYVFDGAKQSPYVESDPPNPLNHYAAGKLAGEQSVLKAHADNLVLRTSWLFGDNGQKSRSYVHTVLRQFRAGTPLKATTDQVSAPTYAPDLARWTLALLQKGSIGLVHTVNDDCVSRFDWTLAIVAEARQAGPIRSEIPVEAVRTDYFGAGIRRPRYTALSNAKAAATLGQTLGSWRPGLRQLLRQLAAATHQTGQPREC